MWQEKSSGTFAPCSSTYILFPCSHKLFHCEKTFASCLNLRFSVFVFCLISPNIWAFFLEPSRGSEATLLSCSTLVSLYRFTHCGFLVFFLCKVCSYKMAGSLSLGFKLCFAMSTGMGDISSQIRVGTVPLQGFQNLNSWTARKILTATPCNRLSKPQCLNTELEAKTQL